MFETLEKRQFLSMTPTAVEVRPVVESDAQLESAPAPSPAAHVVGSDHAWGSHKFVMSRGLS
jgi:hypothetical protein